MISRHEGIVPECKPANPFKRFVYEFMKLLCHPVFKEQQTRIIAEHDLAVKNSIALAKNNLEWLLSIYAGLEERLPFLLKASYPYDDVFCKGIRNYSAQYVEALVRAYDLIRNIPEPIRSVVEIGQGCGFSIIAKSAFFRNIYLYKCFDYEDKNTASEALMECFFPWLDRPRIIRFIDADLHDSLHKHQKIDLFVSECCLYHFTRDQLLELAESVKQIPYIWIINADVPHGKSSVRDMLEAFASFGINLIEVESLWKNRYNAEKWRVFSSN